MKTPETQLTGYSSWLATTGGDGTAGPTTVQSDSEEVQSLLPKESKSWPLAEGILDLYSGHHKRCAQMRFYPVGQNLPKNGYHVVGNGETWLILHAPITSFGPALTMLGLGVKVYLFFDATNGHGGLDTATESPLP